jgi:hypothetical protein
MNISFKIIVMSQVQWLNPVIPATWKAEIGRRFKGPGKKVHETPISTSNWVWWYMPVMPAMWGSTERRISSRLT